VTARSGKWKDPWTVKAHETLYHFHKPETDVGANRWLHKYLLHYNDKPHRTESHSRLEIGYKSPSHWHPENVIGSGSVPVLVNQRRKVDATARVSVEGVAYQVDRT